MPYADVTDIAAQWPDFTEAKTQMVLRKLGRASRMVDNRVPLVDGLTVAERAAASTDFADTVRDVVTDMVLRVLQNPEGARQRSYTIDDGTESFSIAAPVTAGEDVSLGEMYLSPSELADLMGVKARSPRRRAFTIVPSPGRRWCP